MTIQPELMEAYARRLAASLGSNQGTGVASMRRTVFDCHGAETVMEWLAKLEDGSEVRFSAVLTKSPREMGPVEPSREDLEGLRALGISPEGVGHD